MKNDEFTKEWGVGLCSLVAIFTRVFYDPSKRGALKCITNAQEIAISHGDNSWNFKQKRESRNLEKQNSFAIVTKGLQRRLAMLH